MLRAHLRVLSSLAVIILVAPLLGVAGENSKWEWANPVPQGNRLFGVAYGNSQWVMVGLTGTVLTSPDGTSPVHQNTGFTGSLLDVVWTGSQYIAVGGSVATSPDGVIWTEQLSGQVLSDVAWNGSIAVAVGSSGTILTSSDGVTWTPQTSGTSALLRGVVWGGGQFVAVGHSAAILTSPDGVTWTPRSGGATNRAIAWSGSRYIVVGDNAGIYSSPDGVAWTQESTSATGTLWGVTWTGSQFVAVGTYYIITSPDGMVWTNREFLSGLGFNDVGSSPTGDVVAVGDAGRVYTSPDGITWTDHVFDVTWRTHDDIGFNGSDFVAAGGFILHSVDGETWTNPDTAPTYMREVAWGAGRWAMVGGSGTILSSPDGLSWTTETSGTSDTLEGITFGNGQFIAVGANGTILTSPDGMSWTGQTSGVTTVLEAVTWSGTQYIAVGRSTTILSSTDGVSWSDHSQSGFDTLEDVCWTGSRFVVVGTGGTVFTSDDGVVWQDHVFPGSAWAVAWNGLEVTVVTGSGQVWTSPEGINWTEQVSPTVNQLKGMTAVGTDLWVVGGQSLILHRFEEIDFGDAPDPTYPTLLASNGARHLLGGPLFLGSLVDAEPDGQPTSASSGDDINGMDDEDGFSIGLLPIGDRAFGTITASAAGLVNGWMDYNGDGDWDDAGEQVFTDLAVLPGSNAYQLDVPATALPGHTVARIRIDSSGGLSPTGLAPDGEVEDHSVLIVALDWGDAPDPTYPTLSTSLGAYHIIQSGNPFLGASIDGEPDGQPTAGADGDDLDGNDDEDGVVFTSGIGAGLDASLDVTASGPGMLNAWIDFNSDGDWDDAGEQILTDEALATGVNALSFMVPAGATLGTTFARFRLDSSGGLSPAGGAWDGEVEDYQIEIVEGPDLQIEMAASVPYAASGHPMSYTVTVTNNGPLTASSVTVTDTFPSEVIFVSSTPGSPDCVFSVDTLTCDLGTMAPTDTAQITIDVVLDHPVTGTLHNASSVIANELDPIMANNTATVDTLIALFVDGFESGDLTAWD